MTEGRRMIEDYQAGVWTILSCAGTSLGGLWEINSHLSLERDTEERTLTSSQQLLYLMISTWGFIIRSLSFEILL